MYQNNYPSKRYKITIDFVQKHISNDENILDLGIENPLSKILKENGYNVSNTNGEDLDINQSSLKKSNYSVTTAFQIFEKNVAKQV